MLFLREIRLSRISFVCWSVILFSSLGQGEVSVAFASQKDNEGVPKYEVRSINNVNERVVLPKNVINGSNTLTQQMLNSANTYYVIQSDYVLNSNITIPSNCALVFEGGSITGKGDKAVLTGFNTVLRADPVKIFEGVSFKGTFAAECTYAEWFFDYKDSKDSYVPITKAIELARCGIGRVKLLKRKYSISNTITLYNDLILEGVCAGQYQGYDKTQIVCSKEITGIKLDGKLTNGGKEVYVAAITIKDVEISGKNRKGSGVSYYSADSRYTWGCNGITMENVSISGFEYGFSLDGAGKSGSLLNTFQKCIFSGCKIGVYVNRSLYNNSFIFNRCLIRHNDWGGVLFQKSTTQTLKFVDCSIEVNGKCSSYKFDKSYGLFGVRIDTDTDPVLFDNCYFEGNINNDYLADCADIMANSITVRNCLFSSSSHIVSLKGLGQKESNIHIEDCVIYDYNNKVSSKESFIELGNTKMSNVIFLHNRWKSNGLVYTHRDKILNYNNANVNSLSYEGQFVPNKPEMILKK